MGNLFSSNGQLFQKLWEPLTLGILNTETTNASAYLLWNVLKKTFLKGGRFCQIYQPKHNWSESLINPCVNFLKKNNSKIHFNTILKNINIENNYVTKIFFQNYNLDIRKSDKIIITIPPNKFEKIYPIFKLPNEYNTIVNIHFKYLFKFSNKKVPIVGLINSKTHWIFIKHNCISITISAANYLNDFNSLELAKIVWEEEFSSWCSVWPPCDPAIPFGMDLPPCS